MENLFHLINLHLKQTIAVDYKISTLNNQYKNGDQANGTLCYSLIHDDSLVSQQLFAYLGSLKPRFIQQDRTTFSKSFDIV